MQIVTARRRCRRLIDRCTISGRAFPEGDRRGRVLVADDWTEIRDMIRLVLQPFRCTVIDAQDRLEALKLIEIHHPHIILTDVLDGPLEDSLKRLARLLELAQEMGIPVVMQTAYNEERVRCMMPGGAWEHFLQKPWRAGEMRDIVEKLLRERGLW